MNKDQLLLDFFNFEKPCPDNIPFCVQLRQKYQEELDKLTKTGCTACQRNSLKAKFIKDVWTRYVVENS